MMSTKSIWTSLLVVSVIMLGLAGMRLKTPLPVARVNQNNAKQLARAAVLETYGKLPICFEANQGQTDEQVKFIARGNGYTLFLTPQEAVLSLRKPVTGEQSSIVGDQSPIETQWQSQIAGTTKDEQQAASVIRLELVGANRAPRVRGLEELPGKVNHLKGNDPAKWRANVSTYAKVSYQAVYPGVDLVYYGNQQKLEYDFVVAPGADPAAIKLGFAGVDELEVDSQGDLVMQVADEQVRMHKPIIYQEQGGIRQEISGGYKLIARAADGPEANGLPQVGFHVEAYDISHPLVIDPILIYSTFLGGSGQDISNTIAVDGAGSAYITGLTTSLDFPIANALQPVCVCLDQDIFVTKLNPSGSALVYSTYLGGSRRENGFDITVDAAGNAYVSGWTQASDFPLMNPVQPIFGGGDVDAIVFKLNPAGSALVFSTFLGGTGTIEYGNNISVDAAGSVYVAGVTDSPNFPTTNATQPLYAGGATDAFVAKLNSAGSALLYSSCLGGNGRESAQGVCVDNAGVVSVIGVTDSPNFPIVNALQPALAGSYDVFIAKLDPAGPVLVYSTFLGGSASDIGSDIAADAAGNLYLTGQTASTDFPTVNALQPALAGGADAIVVKLSPNGSTLIYSTFLGGSADDWGLDIAVDAAGNASIAGWTQSSDFPTVNAVQATFAGGIYDGIVAKLSPAGSALIYSTYLGGSAEDRGTGIALDPRGGVYVTGVTLSPDFPTAIAFQSAHRGFRDAFIAKLGFTPQAQIQSIIAEVEILVNTNALNQGQGNALIAKLEAAIEQLDKGNTNTAINQLQAFINEVNADISSGKLTPAQGQPLIDAANAIIAALNNPTPVAAAGLKKDDTTVSELPMGFQLEQNSPNPFNPVTTIQFSVQRESYVRLKVYNAFGAEVATLVDRQVAAGTYKVNWDASRLASGFYLYRLEAEGFAQTKKLLLMK